MKYKGFVLNGAHDIKEQEFKMPVCGDKDAILKTRVASVCGSDADCWRNGGEAHYIPEGAEFGHEMVSSIVEVGKDVTNLNIGDRVYPYPLFVTPNPRASGYLGGFSEYVYCTNAELDYNLIKVDPGITDKEASMIEPFTIGFHTADSTGIGENGTAIVAGAGMIGISCAIRLMDRGAKKVVIIDKSKLRLEKASSLGFDTVSTEKENWKELLYKLVGESRGFGVPGLNVDAVVEATGYYPLLKDLMGMLKLFGKMAIVAIHHEPIVINPLQFIFGQITVYGTGGYSYEDVVNVMRVMKSKKFDIESLITHVFNHCDTVAGIETSADAENSLKVLIDYNV